MTEELENIKRRLVVGRKRGGRCIYDETAKAELVDVCLQPGTSVSRVARECGINANQVSRWLREHAHRRKRALIARATPVVSPFVAVPVLASRLVKQVDDAVAMNLQARLPNGVTIELRSAELRQLSAVIEVLGRLPCSV